MLAVDSVTIRDRACRIVYVSRLLTKQKAIGKRTKERTKDKIEIKKNKR
jgi:hypothetical protein